MEEKDADNIRKVLCNDHLVVLRKIEFFFFLSTESTVLIRSGYSFVAVEVKL